MYKGKAIYNPSGKANEYSYWACNFYVGCSNECSYCYLKKGRGAKILGGNKPELKKCFKDKDHAIEVFIDELANNLDELRKHGLFFSFSTDPMLPETKELTKKAITICLIWGVNVKILTKCTDFYPDMLDIPVLNRDQIAIGFTLTGCDHKEMNASTNADRIDTMKVLKEYGFKTFSSIEPIIDFKSSYRMFIESLKFCDLYKIGLESGKTYSKDEAQRFISDIILIASANSTKVYFKDSLLKCAGYERASLKYDCCVCRDYNMFK